MASDDLEPSLHPGAHDGPSHQSAYHSLGDGSNSSSSIKAHMGSSEPNRLLDSHDEQYSSGPRLAEFLNWPELKLQCLIAGPMIFINLFSLCIQLVSVMFVGHLGELSLSRATIATSFANVVGVSVVTGMSTALDTLCGQAYGARQFSLLGVYLQRGLLVLNLTAIPLAVVFAFVGHILQALGQNAEIASGAGEYARLLIPLLFAFACSQPHTRFLLAQSLVLPMVLCAFVTLACHLPLCWALVYRSGLGYRGAAVATSISAWINALLLVSYVNLSPTCRNTRSEPTLQAFRNIPLFLKLALPSAAMICLEWWCYELLVLLAGLLPDPQLEASVLSICLNTGATLYQIPFAIGAAVSTRVSNELGAGRPDITRGAIKVALRISVSEALIVGIILFCGRYLVGRIYSSDAAVISTVASIMPLVVLSSICDSVQAGLAGVARGCGLQKIGAAINLGNYYLLGFPVGCCLAFLTSLRSEGLWLAAVCATFGQCCLYSILVWKIDWDKQALEAAVRSEVSAKLDPLLLT